MSRNLLFHHINDYGPEATNPQAIADFSSAFATVARHLANAMVGNINPRPVRGQESETQNNSVWMLLPARHSAD